MSTVADGIHTDIVLANKTKYIYCDRIALYLFNYSSTSMFL